MGQKQRSGDASLTISDFSDDLLAAQIDSGPLNAALPAIYEELREMASAYLRNERPDHTLQPTALVHESYLRLVAQHAVDWNNRLQFLSIAARMMRRILSNYASRPESREARQRRAAAGIGWRRWNFTTRDRSISRGR